VKVLSGQYTCALAIQPHEKKVHPPPPKRGRCRSQDVAIKVLHRQNLDDQSLNAFRKEVEIVSRIFHPNILLYMGACTRPGHLCIITEHMPRKDLRDLLSQNVPLSLVQRMRMARDAAQGMTWLHSSDPVFIHRDLKTSNLLVDDDLGIKLCDFGLSQIKLRGENLRDGAEGAKGTPLWMAPEVMAAEIFNEKADVYSFGIVLWEILTRREPFEEFDNYDEFRNAICNLRHRPPLPPDTTPALRQLIEACWQHEPARRPSFSQILEAINYIIVDIAILDVDGRRLWKDHFSRNSNKDKVSWTEFLRVFMHYFTGAEDDSEAKMLNIKCLAALLAEKERDGESVVTMEGFGNFASWFGPLSSNQLPPLMERVRSVLKRSYFHGDISTKDAEDRLAGKHVGTFLVRFSTSSPGYYTISKVAADGSIQHQRIVHQPNHPSFYIQNREYASLDNLIQQNAMQLNLVTPCLGSRFAALFVEQNISGYVP
jgi:serine/threonine protein kinase